MKMTGKKTPTDVPLRGYNKPSKRLSCGISTGLIILTVATILTVGPILCWEPKSGKTPHTGTSRDLGAGASDRNPLTGKNRNKRTIKDLTIPSWLDKELSSRNPKMIKINVTPGTKETFQFDLCDVIECGKNPNAWRGYDVYMCEGPFGHPPIGYNPWCPKWEGVRWTTRPDGWYSPYGTRDNKNYEKQRQAITLYKGAVAPNHDKSKLNPLLLTITNLGANPWEGKVGLTTAWYPMIGVDIPGKDPIGVIQLNITHHRRPVTSKPDNSSEISPAPMTPTITPTQDSRVQVFNTSLLSTEQKRGVETGYVQKNRWLDLIESNARMATKENCIVCGAARPNLLMVQTILENNDNFSHCQMEIMTRHIPKGSCKELDEVFPLAPREAIPPIFVATQVNISCIKRVNASTKGYSYGHLPENMCSSITDVSGWTNSSKLTLARADIWWYCGGNTLHGYLAPDWQGTCGLVSLINPIKIYANPTRDEWVRLKEKAREHLHKRSVDYTLNSPIYVDAIGIPRGVPDEYKLADQVAGGFESIFIWVTPNKNIDRINYVHYNVQRLNNLTRDAFEATHGQLRATSLMAYQNRLALDMLLAEKNGVCSMFGTSCCTFIPNNTAIDGSLTRALEGLRTMSQELAEQSGIHNPLQDWLDRTFGQWKVYIMSIFVPLITVVMVLMMCGCCCIPCIRSLCVRYIDNAINKRDFPEKPPPYQLTSLAPPLEPGSFLTGKEDEDDDPTDPMRAVEEDEEDLY